MPRGKPFEPGNEYAFQPGQSGNPGGRPRLVTDAYRRWLETVNEEDPRKSKNADLMAEGVGISAIAGNAAAAAEIRRAVESGGERDEALENALMVVLDR